MAKPRLIILIRHGQSEGNKNRDIHQTIPDHRVKLTADGWQQAYDAGRRLRKMLRPNDTLHFFTSPYRRTRETTEGILTTLTAPSTDGTKSDTDAPVPGEPSPFQREHIKVYEEPRLREQDFGNFQPCSAAMERMWQERADYGHFFYRIPNGESAADAYDRVSGFNESLWRQFGEPGFASVCVLVTHGLMSRVFLMKWYHFTVEYFEDLRNINHCEFLIMRRDEEPGKYVLQNKLRTWSELRKERAREKEKERQWEREREKEVAKNGGAANGFTKADSKHEGELAPVSAISASPVEPRRLWGGCPNGCSHDKSFTIRKVLADLIKCDSAACKDPQPGTSPLATPKTIGTGTGTGTGTGSSNGSSNTSLSSRRPAARRFLSSQSVHEGPNEGGDTPLEGDGPNAEIDVRRAKEEAVSSPDGTPSYISVEDRLRTSLSPSNPAHRLLHVGRDGGGTYSGHNSVVVSDADSSEDEHARRRLARLRLANSTPSNGSASANASASANGNRTGSKGADRLAPAEATGGADDSPPYTRLQREQSGMGRRARANKLGDAPHSSDGEQDAPHSSDGEHDADAEDDVARAEKEDRSIMGSVF